MAAGGADGNGPPAAPRGVAAADLKARLAEELATLARDMAAFQTTLSEVLAAGELSPDQLRQLQDLDRTTQMLDNLHRVATALAAAHPDPVDSAELDALVTLNDLKARLAGTALSARPAPSSAIEDGAADDVSWL